MKYNKIYILDKMDLQRLIMKLIIDCFKLVKGAGKSIGIYNLAQNLVRELAKENNDSKNEIIVLGNTYNKKDFDIDGISFV